MDRTQDSGSCNRGSTPRWRIQDWNEGWDVGLNLFLYSAFIQDMIWPFLTFVLKLKQRTVKTAQVTL